MLTKNNNKAVSGLPSLISVASDPLYLTYIRIPPK